MVSFDKSNTRNRMSEKELLELKQYVAQLREENNTFKIKDLAIDGHDVMAFGFKEAEIKISLNKLLNKVLEDPNLNNRTTLLNLLEGFRNEAMGK